MKNTFGNTISLTIFGESHGPAIGAVLDGLPPGLVIDESYIGNKLRQRRAQGMISTRARRKTAWNLSAVSSRVVRQGRRCAF